ncbi:hypothetical protein GTY54_00780 [Streptomyces sp. SID625]|nr:hypothetical protein [Streptomyces sp. SID625]
MPPSPLSGAVAELLAVAGADRLLVTVLDGLVVSVPVGAGEVDCDGGGVEWDGVELCDGDVLSEGG